MPAVLFDTCCCCIELRTGCLIIGYLQLVGSSILAILVLITLMVVCLSVSGGQQLDTTFSREFRKEYFSSSMSEYFSPDEFHQIKQKLGVILIVFCVILLLVLAVDLAFTVMLLVGVHKNKRGHVKAYLIYTTIFLVLFIILFCVSGLFKSDVGSIVVNLLFFALQIYFLIVVINYYDKMDTNKPAVFRTA